MFKSRLYLDVDGCIAADKPQFPDATSLTYTTKLGYGLVEKFHLTYSPTVLNTLERFRNDYAVELVFHSTWNDDLHVTKLARMFGVLLDARVTNISLPKGPQTNRERTKWKADTLLSDQKVDPLPFAWVDDEAHKYHAKDVVAAVGDTPHLLVTPRPYWGLTQSNLDRMETFFKSL